MGLWQKWQKLHSFWEAIACRMLIMQLWHINWYILHEIVIIFVSLSWFEAKLLEQSALRSSAWIAKWVKLTTFLKKASDRSYKESTIAAKGVCWESAEVRTRTWGQMNSRPSLNWQESRLQLHSQTHGHHWTYGPHLHSTHEFARTHGLTHTHIIFVLWGWVHSWAISRSPTGRHRATCAR